MNRASLAPVAYLALLGAIAGALLALTRGLTAERIADNRLRETLRGIAAVLPAGEYDNQPHLDRIDVVHPELLGTPAPRPAYRARRGATPVAVALRYTAPGGYVGPLELVAGIRPDGTLVAVRVIAHSETPGLGDAVDRERADWIDVFAGRSLRDPASGDWAVDRDGGSFDAITGATVTSRAVVDATRRALEYFESHRDELLAAPAATP